MPDAPPPRSLAALLRADPVLRWGTLVGACLVCVPLFAARIVPNVDLGGHIGLAGALPGLLRGDPVAAGYALAPYPMPYTLVYAALGLFVGLFGPFVGAKLLIAATLVLMPLAVMRFAASLGRDPRLGLVAFLFAWDANLEWGFFAFSIGVAVTLFALARLHESETAADARRVIPLTLALAFTHAQAGALFLGAAFFLAFARPGFVARLRLHAIAATGLLAGLVPWVLGSLLVPATTQASKYSFFWLPIGRRIDQAFERTLDLVPGDAGRTSAGLIFLALLVAPALFTLLPTRDDGPPPAKLVPLLAYFVLLYWLLPHAIGFPIPQTMIHVRHAMFALFAPLLLAPVDLRGRWLPITVGVLLTFAMGARAIQYRAFDRENEPFFEVAAHIERPGRIAAFTPHENSATASLTPYRHIGGWLAAATASFCGTTWNTSKLPVHPRNEAGLPPLDYRDEATFDLARHGPAYDWILLLRDDVAASPIAKFPAGAVELVYEKSFWHLYRVVHAP